MALHSRFTTRALSAIADSRGPIGQVYRGSRCLATSAAGARKGSKSASETTVAVNNVARNRTGPGAIPSRPQASRVVPPSRRRRRPVRKEKEVEPLRVTLPHTGISASQLATLSSCSSERVLSTAREIDPSLAADPSVQLSPALVELVADAMGAPLYISHQVQSLGLGAQAKQSRSKEDWSRLPLRVPVVTIMGHVDVGKTTLLDALRKSNVADLEKGGITQSIGAFRVSLPSAAGPTEPQPTVTFIDTPGHEAFTSMRAHGAGATDVVVLVVAADDGVMPQTVEAADHARAAGVPIVVAINKCDKEGADADRARYQLLEMTGVNTEQLGGDVQCVEISAKAGINLDGLVEAILLQAEVLDLRADPSAPAEAICLESRVHRQLGQVATVVVKWGRLQVGDYFVHSSLSAVSGDVFGRVRSMVDSNGTSVKEARTGDAVAISGFKGSIQPGAELLGVVNEKKAKTVSQGIVARNALADSTVDLIADLERRAEMKAVRNSDKSAVPATPAGVAEKASSASVENGDGGETAGNINEGSSSEGAGNVPVPTINIIVKADVQGAADAVAQCVERLSSADCPVRILSVGVGDVTDNDVILASATQRVKGNIDESLVVAFNVRVPQGAKTLAKRSTVDVLTHSLIYKLEEDLMARNKDLIQSREKKEHVVGAAGIVRVFEDGAIAGCLVQDGKVLVGNLARVLRFPVGGSDSIREPVHEGTIGSIKQFAKDVRSVAKGSECGLGIEGWGGFLPGDVIECIQVETPQTQARKQKKRR